MGFETVLLAASTGLKIMGQLQEGKAASNAAKYSAAIADNNAKIAEQNARWVGADADQKIAMRGLADKSRLGRIKTNQAAGNIDVNSGSAADVRASQNMVDKLDSLTLRSNAAREAYGLQNKAQYFKGEAAQSRAAAKYATRKSYMDAAGTILGGGYDAYKAGAFSDLMNRDSINVGVTEDSPQVINSKDGAYLAY